MTTIHKTPEANLSEIARLLGHAADNGELTTVQQLLTEYPDAIHARGGIMGSTPLHFAAASGHLPIVQALIRAGADVNAREAASDSTPIHWASAHGHLEVVQALVGSGAEIAAQDGWYRLSPIAWACALPQTAQLPVADYLVAQGATYDIFSLIALQNDERLEALLHYSNTAMESRVGQIGEVFHPLHWAVRKSGVSTIRVLIEAGADINARTAWGVSAHALAITYGKADLADYLVEQGADNDLSSLTDLLASGAECHLLPHYMVSNRDIEGLKTILEVGADPNVLSEAIIDSLLCGVTPLHRAVLIGEERMTQLLLQFGADVNAPCLQVDNMPYWDITPLHIAAFRGHLDIAEILVEHGADTSAQDFRGTGTPLDWAISWGNDIVTNYLKQHRR